LSGLPRRVGCCFPIHLTTNLFVGSGALTRKRNPSLWRLGEKIKREKIKGPAFDHRKSLPAALSKGYLKPMIPEILAEHPGVDFFVLNEQQGAKRGIHYATLHAIGLSDPLRHRQLRHASSAQTALEPQPSAEYYL